MAVLPKPVMKLTLVTDKHWKKNLKGGLCSIPIVKFHLLSSLRQNIRKVPASQKCTKTITTYTTESTFPTAHQLVIITTKSYSLIKKLRKKN